MPEVAISKAAVRQVLVDYWQQYKRQPLHSLIAFLLPAIGSIFVFFVPPLIVAQLVDTLATGDVLTLESIGWHLALFGLFWFLGESLWRVGRHYLIKIEASGLSALSKEGFKRLASRDYDFYTNHFVGSLTKKASAYTRGFEIFTDIVAFNIITNLFPIIFATIVLWQYSPWLPSLLIGSLLVVVAITIPIIRKRSRLVAIRHAASSKMAGYVSDTLSNVLAVKSFAKENAERSSFGQTADAYTTAFKNAADYHNLRLELAVSPLYVGANVAGLGAALYFTHTLGLAPGTLVVVFAYYSQITRVFWEINHIYRSLESAVSEAAELTQLTLAPPIVQDTPHAHSLTVTAGVIEFKDMHFSYAGNDKGEHFFDRFNLVIRGGESVGLVGPSGSGKTTITKLLLRFVDLNSGSILIDGQEIHSVTQHSLRENISYVPQEPLLFHRSLFENIAYGLPHARMAEVVQAAKLAHAHEFIIELPQNYETLVGERGVKLSGGQRQRIAIARAILKNAPILILDEATSSLDSESEKYIQEGLVELMKGKTAIVIAHRLSTIKHLDRIIVLKEGAIAQEGTHTTLINKKGLYAKLWEHQAGGFLEE